MMRIRNTLRSIYLATLVKIGSPANMAKRATPPKGLRYTLFNPHGLIVDPCQNCVSALSSFLRILKKVSKNWLLYEDYQEQRVESWWHHKLEVSWWGHFLRRVFHVRYDTILCIYVVSDICSQKDSSFK